jgi:hypothetical protein
MTPAAPAKKPCPAASRAKSQFTLLILIMGNCRVILAGS